jgi:hypothetical protein
MVFTIDYEELAFFLFIVSFILAIVGLIIGKRGARKNLKFSVGGIAIGGILLLMQLIVFAVILLAMYT